jgi:glycosyltransferase involved in cell wall biosynthesis
MARSGDELEREDLDLMVIIPCHNEEATLAEQLDSLTAQEWSGRWAITVVNNRSTDRTEEIAASYRDRGVRCIEANDGSGVAYARNQGVRHTTSRSVAFCDGDDVASAGWVAAMGDALALHPLVTGVLDVSTINGPAAASLRPASSSQSLPHFGAVPFARGNNCGMHRTLWEQLDGYDEHFVGLEDIEFSLRASAAGVTPVLAAGAEVRYRFRTDRRSVWRQAYYYGRGRAALAKQARELHIVGPKRTEGLRSWGWLLLHLPELRSATGRLRLLWVIGNRLGVLHGALEARTFHV